MLSRRKLFLAAAVLSSLIICMTGPAAGFATTWDVTTQFSSTTNPLGAWSYGYEASGGGTLNLFTVETAGSYGPDWTSIVTNGDGVPGIWKNNSGSTEYLVPPGDVTLNPGYDPTTALCVARWTSPGAGTVTINGSFGAGDSYPMDYYIYENGSNIYSLIFTTFTNVDGPFSLTESVTAGTTIDFAVGPGQDGY
jgi:hypothetical protein